MTDFAGVLSGVRVLEISEGIAGPVCGQQLADLGADVIKVEPPEGDRARSWGAVLADGQSAIFAHLNRGKRSVVCDFSDQAGRSALRDLVEGADVIVVHQDPAQARALGWDWAEIAAESVRRIVCDITDLGTRGPFAGRAGSELTAQVLSGFSRYAGSSEAPARVGYEIALVGTGMGAVQAVLAMLWHRAQTGRGDYCAISVLGHLLTQKQILLAAQTDPDIWEGFHLNGPHWAPDVGWQTRDGQVTFDFRHGLRDEWAAFCRRVGLAELPDAPEYEDWRSTIYIGDRKDTHGGVYRDFFARSTCAEASATINELGGISVKFQDYAELLAHPQLDHLRPFVTVPEAPEGARRQIATPFVLVGSQAGNPAPLPAPSRPERAIAWDAPRIGGAP
jgi:crotonobetainyl-CoA:carnitine CoA-transferase CaiB-like acyl-CoA transferase